MSNFTPIPWGRICMYRDGCRCGYIMDGGGTVIAKAFYNDPSIPDKYHKFEDTITIEEADANMDLIASSPYMYIAIKELLNVPGIVDCMPINVWDMLENAISKAEGKE